VFRSGAQPGQVHVINFAATDPKNTTATPSFVGSVSSKGLINASDTVLSSVLTGATMFGQANAADVAAVGAIDYQQTPQFGGTLQNAESYSSESGIPILFDSNGNRSAATTRPGVRFVAPDNVDNTFFGASDPDGDSFPNFSGDPRTTFAGTSAAAPHAAGVAALLLQGRSDLKSNDVFTAMEHAAIPLTHQLLPMD